MRKKRELRRLRQARYRENQANGIAIALTLRRGRQLQPTAAFPCLELELTIAADKMFGDGAEITDSP